MKAFLLYGPGDIRAADLPSPVPGPGEVVITMRRAGICGSDKHYYTHGQVGSFVPRRPFVLGHEFAGEIAEVGAGVPASRIGERVAVDPSMPCGRCGYCQDGRHNLCPEMRFFGSASCDPHIDGGFEEYILAPASNAFTLDASLSWGEAAMAEPLSVALHAAKRAGRLDARSVLVLGGGAIGQLTAMVARSFGAAPIVVCDPLPGARRKALACGADAALDPLSPGFADEALARAPGGFDVVFEAAGAPEALERALFCSARGGTIVQIGTLPATVSLPLNAVMSRELSLVGSFRFGSVFRTALDLMGSGRIDVKPLISAVHALGDFGAAMAQAMNDRDCIKVQIAA